MSHPNRAGRPRRALDPAKMARARELWLSGKSLSMAARIAGTTRHMLMSRFPEFKAFASDKRRKTLARYYHRKGEGE